MLERLHIGTLIVCLLIPNLVGGLSGFAAAKGTRDWYPTLIKPPFNPPSSVFGPVWITLYCMMGITLYLLYTAAPDTPGRSAVLSVFFLQLVFNGLWSILFFWFQQPGWALIDILALLLSIIATIVLSLPVSRAGALLLVPYLLWVSFATYLNAMLWHLN